MAGARKVLARTNTEEPNMYFNRLHPGRILLRALMSLAPLAALTCAGCDTVGVVASKVVGVPDVAPAYTGLKGQHVAIMVWADEGATVDHPSLRSDVAFSLQNKLQQGVDAKVDELKGTTFLDVSRILRYQEAHPESQSDSAEQIALRLPPATRLIYVEVQSVSLHPNEAVDLSRGQAVADIRVIEVADGVTKIGYQNDNISGVYPPHSPPEGMPGLADDEVYHKSIDALTTELGKLFIAHQSEDDHQLDNDHEQ
jgi:hypothetical protein